MTKLKTILYDTAIAITLIVNLLSPTIYSGYLTKFIAIITIVNCILMFGGYCFKEEIIKKHKKELKKHLKKEKGIWKFYQYITNVMLVVLFALNNMLFTAVFFAFGIKIINSFRDKIYES